jgi:hypothetical protein
MNLLKTTKKTHFLKRKDPAARLISLDVVDSLKWRYENSSEFFSIPAQKAYQSLNNLSDKKLIELNKEINTKVPSHAGPNSEDEEKALDDIVTKYNVDLELVKTLN